MVFLKNEKKEGEGEGFVRLCLSYCPTEIHVRI